MLIWMAPVCGYGNGSLTPPAGGVMVDQDVLTPAPSVDGTVATLQMLSEQVIPPCSMAYVSCMVDLIPGVWKQWLLGHMVNPQALHCIASPFSLTLCQIHPTKTQNPSNEPQPDTSHCICVRLWVSEVLKRLQESIELQWQGAPPSPLVEPPFAFNGLEYLQAAVQQLPAPA